MRELGIYISKFLQLAHCKTSAIFYHFWAEKHKTVIIILLYKFRSLYEMCAMLLYLADRCTGCRTCELACSMIHDNVFNPAKSRIRVQLEGVPELFTVNVCKSCGKPPCEEACPTDPK